MTDNDIAAAIRAALLELLAEQGYADVGVIQSYQPTTQGRQDGPVLYYFELPAALYGWQGRSHKFDPATGISTTTERQWIQSSFQMGGLSPQDPTDLSRVTAMGLTRMAAMLVNSEGFRRRLRTVGIGLQRVSAIRNIPFENDREQFEYSSSFDFTVSWQQRIVQSSDSIDAEELNITRV